MLAVVIVIAVVVAVAVAVPALAIIRGRKVDTKASAEPGRAPIPGHTQDKLLEVEAGLVRDVMTHRISPIVYRKRMRDLAEAARDWPRPVVRT
ncbi:hypothetical protein [Smaragdicoccus niigatensis]|uniref:hypothetical protein n=1 Tax=Smaragdicoccus niigatensis TaxID=359359 RepID=UPI00037DB0A1|nr:hypothetical protein [Smaragdicoccus niigatensis]